MRICVFCGSSAGHNPLYANAARETGRTIAARGMDLVYGGGRVGLMGELADAVLGAGGVVIGVMPKALVDREIQHSGLTDLQIVATMHERKTRMAELADGFLALSGRVAPSFSAPSPRRRRTNAGASWKRRCTESSCSAVSTSVQQ